MIWKTKIIFFYIQTQAKRQDNNIIGKMIKIGAYKISKTCKKVYTYNEQVWRYTQTIDGNFIANTWFSNRMQNHYHRQLALVGKPRILFDMCVSCSRCCASGLRSRRRGPAHGRLGAAARRGRGSCGGASCDVGGGGDCGGAIDD